MTANLNICMLVIYYTIILHYQCLSFHNTLDKSVVAEKSAESCGEDLVLSCEDDSVIFMKKLDSTIALKFGRECLESKFCQHIISEDNPHWLSLKSTCSGKTQCQHSISQMSIGCWLPWRVNYELIVYHCVTLDHEIQRETSALSCGNPLQLSCEDIPNGEILLDPWQSWLSSAEWDNDICYYYITCRDYTSDLDPEHWESLEYLCNKQRQCEHKPSMEQLACSQMSSHTYEQIVYYCVISDDIKSSTPRLIPSDPTVSSEGENITYYPQAVSGGSFPTIAVIAVCVVLMAVLTAITTGVLFIVKWRRRKQAGESRHSDHRTVTVTQNDYTLPENSQVSNKFEQDQSAFVTDQQQLNHTYVNFTGNQKTSEDNHIYANINGELCKQSQAAAAWSGYSNQNKNIENETKPNEATGDIDDSLMKDNEIYNIENETKSNEATGDIDDSLMKDNEIYNIENETKPNEATGNIDDSPMEDNVIYSDDARGLDQPWDHSNHQ